QVGARLDVLARPGVRHSSRVRRRVAGQLLAAQAGVEGMSLSLRLLIAASVLSLAIAPTPAIAQMNMPGMKMPMKAKPAVAKKRAAKKAARKKAKPARPGATVREAPVARKPMTMRMPSPAAPPAPDMKHMDMGTAAPAARALD